MRRPRATVQYLYDFIALALLLSVVLWILITYAIAGSVLVPLHYNDFGKFYYAVLQARQGQSLYAANVATLIQLSKTVSRQFWDLNPPHFHLLVWPVSYLPLRQAYIAWMIGNAALVLVSLALVRKELSLRLSVRGYVVAGVVLVAAAPTVTWFVTGQLTGVLAALATWIWIELRRQRWNRAGIAIGLACSLKLFLAPLVLYLAFRRRWSAALAAAAAAGICFAIGVLVFGLAAHRDWLLALQDVQWTWAAMNASAIAPLARIIVPSAALAGNTASSPAVTVAATAVSGALLIAGLWGSIRARSVDCGLCVLYLTCLLTSPLGWVYYHWILIGPAVATFRGYDRRWICAAGAGLLVPFFLLAFTSAWLAVTVGSLYTWSTLLLWGMAMRIALGDAGAQRSATIQIVLR